MFAVEKWMEQNAGTTLRYRMEVDMAWPCREIRYVWACDVTNGWCAVDLLVWRELIRNIYIAGATVRLHKVKHIVSFYRRHKFYANRCRYHENDIHAVASEALCSFHGTACVTQLNKQFPPPMNFRSLRTVQTDISQIPMTSSSHDCGSLSRVVMVRKTDQRMINHKKPEAVSSTFLFYFSLPFS